MELHVYGSETRSSYLYEDACDGHGYRDGDSMVKMFKLDCENDLRLFQSREGSFQPRYATYRVIFHGMPVDSPRAEVDGEELELAREKNTWVAAEVPESFSNLRIFPGS